MYLLFLLKHKDFYNIKNPAFSGIFFAFILSPEAAPTSTNDAALEANIDPPIAFVWLIKRATNKQKIDVKTLPAIFEFGLLLTLLNFRISNDSKTQSKTSRRPQKFFYVIL